MIRSNDQELEKGGGGGSVQEECCPRGLWPSADSVRDLGQNLRTQEVNRCSERTIEFTHPRLHFLFFPPPLPLSLLTLLLSEASRTTLPASKMVSQCYSITSPDRSVDPLSAFRPTAHPSTKKRGNDRWEDLSSCSKLLREGNRKGEQVGPFRLEAQNSAQH